MIPPSISWPGPRARRRRNFASGRPRTFVYLTVISIVVAVMATALSTRKTFDLNVLHERSPVYVELSGNRIRQPAIPSRFSIWSARKGITG